MPQYEGITGDVKEFAVKAKIMWYWWQKIKYEYGALCNNDRGVGGLRYLEKNLSNCHSAHHKSHTQWLWIVPRPPQKNTETA